MDWEDKGVSCGECGQLRGRFSKMRIEKCLWSLAS